MNLLANAQIPVRTNAAYKIQHDKVIIHRWPERRDRLVQLLGLGCQGQQRKCGGDVGRSCGGQRVPGALAITLGAGTALSADLLKRM
ncbi:hypothetical protein CFBP3846_P200070 (plasmid) [Pseudomonas syringae pv. avii]|uniref:Uncharacterized protein n=1 Tax=Pseudomonas syringae pv. avii TaxID=663959 RepID=A0ABY1UFC2_PSESX|nr:hypothetical protein CFBP3846_P200070 [Pseudomonas syringae pv. avii]